MDTKTQARQRAVAPRATPAPRPAPPRPRTAAPHRVVPAAPDLPSLTHRLLPQAVRNTMATLGWWQNPIPQKPSTHLEQTIAVLTRYGWGRSLDFSPTGRMCIRGAQTLLETTGHVTAHHRARAIGYMQTVLAEHGVTMPYFAWNDLPDQQFSRVEDLLHTSARTARQNGE
ncbi:hypothetical protein ACFQ6Q_00515 [Streptomyces sp. NPDC056437]|uniref:DUF6197 family protein n=1 Tax=Streptomyces sp. NPDC056437 TaxID=3345816 RepID=UPI00369E5CD0